MRHLLVIHTEHEGPSATNLDPQRPTQQEKPPAMQGIFITNDTRLERMMLEGGMNRGKRGRGANELGCAPRDGSATVSSPTRLCRQKSVA